MTEPGFLGNGLGFPVRCDPATGRMNEAPEEEDIRQAIAIILSTKRGERIMRPEFGCDIYNYAFGIMDYTTLRLMENAVVEAIIRWEPRIRNLNVRAEIAEEEEGMVMIQIDYHVRSTNNRFNIVYPFYLSEGTGGE